MKLVDLAKLTHEANRTYCSILGDNTQAAWEDAPLWQQKSAVNNVVFHLTNREASPAASHESWLAEKERDGWKYGPVKDADKKEHPCFVPFSELPVAQRLKDALFRNIVHAVLDTPGMTIEDDGMLTKTDTPRTFHLENGEISLVS